MNQKLQIPTHWDERHAICSLYFLVADADGPINKNEIEVIEKKISHLLLDTYLLSTDEKIKIATEAMYVTLGLLDESKMQWIKALATQARIKGDLYLEMISAIEDIAQADDFVTIEEHSLMYYIRLQFKKDYIREAVLC